MTEPRSDTEIDADLALPYSATEFDAATARLVADVKPLRARVSELTAENARLEAECERLRGLVGTIYPCDHHEEMDWHHEVGKTVTAERDKALAERDRMSDLATERTGLWNTARAELDVERARREAADEWLQSDDAVETVAVEICPGTYCESHGECREDAVSALDAVRIGLTAAAVPLEAPTEKEPSDETCTFGYGDRPCGVKRSRHSATDFPWHAFQSAPKEKP